MKTTEKQMAAKQLYTKFHSFHFTEAEYVGDYGRKAIAHVCIINGHRCVLASDLWHLVDCLRRCVENGLLTRRDYLVGRRGDSGAAGGRSCSVIKIDAVKAIREEYLKMRRSDGQVFDRYVSCAEGTQDVFSETISAEEIGRIWDCYDERQRLITEGTRERKAEKEQEEREEWMRRQGIEEGKPKDDLADLVDRIEAMGWHVTLTRKEGA